MYFLVLTSFFVIAFLWKLYYDHKDARFGLPGPPILPLFGNFLQLKDSIKSGHGKFVRALYKAIFNKGISQLQTEF